MRRLKWSLFQLDDRSPLQFLSRPTCWCYDELVRSSEWFYRLRYRENKTPSNLRFCGVSKEDQDLLTVPYHVLQVNFIYMITGFGYRYEPRNDKIWSNNCTNTTTANNNNVKSNIWTTTAAIITTTVTNEKITSATMHYNDDKRRLTHWRKTAKTPSPLAAATRTTTTTTTTAKTTETTAAATTTATATAITTTTKSTITTQPTMREHPSLL